MLDLKPVKEIDARHMTKATRRNQPFVVRQWFKDNPCPLDHPIWNNDAHAVVVVPQEISSITYTTPMLRKMGHHHNMTYQEVFERIQGQGQHTPVVKQQELYYVFGGVLPKGFLKHFAWPKKMKFRYAGSFVASKGVLTKAHIDYQWAYLVQMHGSKTVKLFPPSDYKYVYPYTKEPILRPRRILIDLDKPDFEKYPLLKKSHGQVATLQPGDLLFLPNCWFHEVRTHGFSVGFNYRVKKNFLHYYWTFIHFSSQMILARLFYQVKPLDTYQIKGQFKTAWKYVKLDLMEWLQSKKSWRFFGRISGKQQKA